MLRSLRVLDEIGAVHDSLRRAAGEPHVTDATVRAEPEETPPSWGHLRIVRKLGEGSYGEVFLAEDGNLKQHVALKLLRPPGWAAAEEDGILEEARRLARVRHPNVLTVHGADRIDGRVGIWSDYIDGETLEDLLKANGPFGPEEATHIGMVLCGALAGVHAAGLVHGDIKTANVMREKGGRIVLMDFSSARDRLPDRGTEDSVTGTPLYMAPEMFRGEVTPAADIYSLGAVLFRLVSNRYPVDGASIREIEEKHHRGETRSLRDACPSLPRAFVKVVERALAPDPQARYASAGEMEQALAAWQGTVGGRPVPRPASRRIRWVRFAGAGLMIFAAVGVWHFWPHPLEVEAHLFRAGNHMEERLQPGSRIAPGDQLFLEIEGSRKMYVYVFDEDQEGRAVRLYPLESLDLENPLSPNVRHRLPGEMGGVPYYWNVTSAGGAETILTVASRKPLAAIEATFGALAEAGDVEAVTLPARLDSLRGIAGLSSGPQGVPSSGEAEAMGRIRQGLDFRAGSGQGVWLWEMRLSNPKP